MTQKMKGQTLVGSKYRAGTDGQIAVGNNAGWQMTGTSVRWHAETLKNCLENRSRPFCKWMTNYHFLLLGSVLTQNIKVCDKWLVRQKY